MLRTPLTCSDPHGEFQGQNCLIERESIEKTASALGLAPKEAEQTLAKARGMLHAKRTQRPHPHVDDKVSPSAHSLREMRIL
jgi:uncharacterized protein YyaL (SSP411 family)